FNKGSIPEIIKDGETGYVVNDVDEMIEAVKKIKSISRAKTRDYALKNFNSKIMAKGYERVYKEVIVHKKG
ncbi:MAG: Mannose-6-phosphate isomerase, bifunctional enzyme, partial [Candidatus Daviesbacteria bacterium GW2011_GWA1_41_61]